MATIGPQFAYIFEFSHTTQKVLLLLLISQFKSALSLFFHSDEMEI